MCGFQGTQKPYTISGDTGERDPPVPIPNTEVKPFSADGTWLETTWESRTLPDSTKKSLRRCLGLFLCASRQVLLPGRFQANVQHCTWLGSPMCAASGGSSTWGNTWESRTLPDSTKKSLRRCLVWRSTFHVTKGAYMGKNGITRDRTGKPWYYRNSKR